MNELHRHLQALAFQLLQTGEDLDARAAAWIQKHVKADRQRSRRKGKRKVRLADHGKGGEFWLDADRLTKQ